MGSQGSVMLDTELCMIGAGPAGMAAARTAADSGVSCVLLDEQSTAGGQIYRGVAHSSHARRRVLGRDYEAGLGLTEALDHPDIQYCGGVTVWSVQPNGTVGYSRQGRGQALRARRVLLATGALERPVPIPGWTLPGVMTAGAAQILLEGAGLLGQRAVIAGRGRC
ncbi:MAG: FAD-dependent oxidoreductase [Arhodomonas sp.]|nr:FAD-dependent oxidoreductase [Arhodomonas sp.]